MHRSGLPCVQLKGQDAPYSTDITTVPDIGVTRTSALQPADGPVASSTIVPSSRGDPTSTAQPRASSALRIAVLAAGASMFTANVPLVGPDPGSAGSWPGRVGKDGGSASKIVPKSVLVVVGMRIDGEAPADGPPGTGVRLGAAGDELDAGWVGLAASVADGPAADAGGELDPQAPSSTPSRIEAAGRSDTAKRRRSVITG